MSEDNAELEALEEIEQTLSRHWMRKPRRDEQSASADAPDETAALQEDSGDILAEAAAEGESPAEESAEQDAGDTDDSPISVIDYGIKRAMRERSPIEQPPMKRGRGRPRKNA